MYKPEEFESATIAITFSKRQKFLFPGEQDDVETQSKNTPFSSLQNMLNV
jgi:hypothetical protein